MGQAHSFDDTGYAIVAPTAGVPMLDWPSDLFSDNASPADLEMVDFLLECEPAFLPHAQRSEDLSIQLAA